MIFLGTNGWYDTATGNTISILLRTKDYDIVLDAGYGIGKLDRYKAAEDRKPVFLFLSHFHIDHIAGLHILAKYHFLGGLTICGPTDSKKMLHVIANNPFTLPLELLPYFQGVVELPQERDRLPFTVTALPLVHSTLTLGYRFEIDGQVIGYVADTGYCENAVSLAKGADLLFTECAFRAGQTNEYWPHLNPETGARIAAESGAKKLALVHFDAFTHPDLEARKESESVARDIFPNTCAAFDDMVITLKETP
ncbi:MAG: MBL fold metallo-hydrolase [Smithellaceae bacterium]|nr:MBL fold metallo-hydrolase [Smithellaceae bacterium]